MPDPVDNSAGQDDAAEVLAFLGLGDLGSDNEDGGDGGDGKARDAPPTAEKAVDYRLCVNNTNWYLSEPEAERWGLVNHSFRDVRTNKANLATIEGRYDDALSLWQDLLDAAKCDKKLRPKTRDAKIVMFTENIARCISAKGEHQRACELMETIAEQYPHLMRAARYNFLATCYHHLGQVDSEIDAGRRSLAKDFEVLSCFALCQAYLRRITTATENAPSTDSLSDAVLVDCAWVQTLARGVTLTLVRDLGKMKRASSVNDALAQPTHTLTNILQFNPRLKSLMDLLRAVVSLYHFARVHSKIEHATIPEPDSWKGIIEDHFKATASLSGGKAYEEADRTFLDTCESRSQIVVADDAQDAVAEGGGQVSSSAARAGFDPMSL